MHARTLQDGQRRKAASRLGADFLSSCVTAGGRRKTKIEGGSLETRVAPCLRHCINRTLYGEPLSNFPSFSPTAPGVSAASPPTLHKRVSSLSITFVLRQGAVPEARVASVGRRSRGSHRRGTPGRENEPGVGGHRRTGANAVEAATFVRQTPGSKTCSSSLGDRGSLR